MAIAVALGMDALAVSISCGCSFHQLKMSQYIQMAFFFGFFQAVMPMIGWYGGKKVYHLINRFDHWIAFGLLFLVGIRMIWEAYRSDSCQSSRGTLTLGFLLTLSVATSIDALAVGLGLGVMNESILLPAIIIGVVTFMMSLTGGIVGKQFSGFLGRRVEVFGGILLIAIGLKILVQHLGGQTAV